MTLTTAYTPAERTKAFLWKAILACLSIDLFDFCLINPARPVKLSVTMKWRAEMNDKGQTQVTHSDRALQFLSLSMLAGVAGIAIYVLQPPTISDDFSVLGVGLFVAGAALVLGGILGFLFGIPRTLQRESTGPERSAKDTTVDYQANTNLEQISDWLTKMLVGVGLTQLTSMPTHLKGVSEYIATGLGSRPSDLIIALAIILYFSVIGFLFGYLWTRLNFAGALRQADMMAIGALVSRVEQTDRKIEDLKKQSELDVKALNLTYRQLNPGSDLPDVSDEELKNAVGVASRPIKVQIFNQAWRIRGDNWRDNKPLMERTIPIFRALIHSDTEGRYHLNHGQLGFALKDQRQPDWAEAERELSTAIQIRESWKQHGWLFYEFNRAICRIMLDESFAKDESSTPDAQSVIVADIRAAWKSELKKLILQDTTISRWMKTNNINQKDLHSDA